MMERKEIKIKIGDEMTIETDYNLGDKPTGIDELIKFLEGRKNEGATHVEISGTMWSAGSIDYVDVQPIKIKLESEEDFKARVAEKEAEELRKKKSAEKRERTLYERLKSKYDHKPRSRNQH